MAPQIGSLVDRTILFNENYKNFFAVFFQFYVIKDRTGVIMSKSFRRIKPTIDIFLNWTTDYVSVKERKIKKQQKRMER